MNENTGGPERIAGIAVANGGTSPVVSGPSPKAINPRAIKPGRFIVNIAWVSSSDSYREFGRARCPPSSLPLEGGTNPVRHSGRILRITESPSGDFLDGPLARQIRSKTQFDVRNQIPQVEENGIRQRILAPAT